MKLPRYIHKEGFLFFLIGSVLFYLTSVYFGGVYIRLARFWFALYVLDFILLIINSQTLRYSLDFDRDHISKGDHIKYSIKIQKGTPFPVPWIRIEQARIHSRQGDETPPQFFSLLSDEIWEYKQDVHAEIRGVYTLGLSRLSLRGLTAVLSVDLPIWSQSFYVYPRLIDIPEELRKHPSNGGSSKALTGSQGEAYMFQGLREYRAGEGLSNISWSRFVQWGLPFIKTYTTRGGDEIHLFLDRRSSGRIALCDDTVLEVFLCLVFSAVHTGQKLIIHGYPGWENQMVSTEQDFRILYQSTLLLEFDVPDLEELREIPSTGGLYVVSGLSDLELLDEFSSLGSIDHLIPVTIGMDEEDLLSIRSLIIRLEQRGAIISEITSSSTLEDELQCRLYS